MKNFWDKFTDKLGRTIFHPQFFLKNLEHKAVLESQRLGSGGTIVDIGCGRQPYKTDLLPYFSKYIGVDHPNVSKKYQSSERPDILADATNIPLPKNSADLTLMISVLEHLPDPLKALKEAYRITKSHGYFVTIAPQNYRLHDIPFDYFRFTKFGLKEILKKSGFTIIKIMPLGSYPILMSQYFNIFIMYNIKSLASNGGFLKLIAALLSPLALAICFLSNILALILSQIGKEDASGSFAIYNLAIAKKS